MRKYIKDGNILVALNEVQESALINSGYVLLKEESKGVEKSAPIPLSTEYTKTEINRMPKDELVKLAKSVGIKNVGDKSGAELKATLIKHYGL